MADAKDCFWLGLVARVAPQLIYVHMMAKTALEFHSSIHT
eukprot:COSAG03_NODE_142_length_11687_cov_11.710131_4_plen_40_part_00